MAPVYSALASCMLHQPRMSRCRPLLFAILLLLAPIARAQQNNALTLVLSVQDDGSALATERLTLASPMQEPLHWRIPTAVVSPLGVRRLLFIDVLEISDGRGNLLHTRARHFGDALDVLVPIQPLADNTLRVTYSVRNAVRFRDSDDDLIWPLARAWSVRIHDASVFVTLPAHAAGQVSAQLLRGTEFSYTAMPLAFEGNRATWEIVSPDPNQTLLHLVFAPGILQRPSLPLRVAWFLRANPVFLFLALLLIAIILFRRYSRRDVTGTPIVPRYEPPADLPPVEAGVLIDNRLDPRDLAAMLLDLARRGFIRVEPGTPDEGVPYSAPDFVLRLLKPMDSWKDAYPYEHTVLFHTFYGGQWTKLSSLSLRFYAVVPTVERIIRDELLRKGLYVPRWRVTVQRIAALALVAVVFGLAQLFGWFSVVQSGTLALIALVSLGVIVPFLARGVSHRTARGDAVLTELRGFQEFMNSVEADRMQRVTPDLFESFLPYAVALGVEHQWGAAFSTISTGPPLWWDHANRGGIPDFVRLVGHYSIPTRRAAAANRKSTIDNQK